ncbi:hypothetical protein HMPREF9104_00763 [Lentilactobacillus kisonensis F0435]|uniref:Uncharacterized protein n=1 Tax=Lentilactobacillus kisonensis F0435 TaxID=797516 RepID=H1LDT8_9LACO|nr:hypothetical protein HMPREF9104_00763 [Lentilactobacillus kisonensis F0435]
MPKWVDIGDFWELVYVITVMILSKMISELLPGLFDIVGQKR